MIFAIVLISHEGCKRTGDARRSPAKNSFALAPTPAGSRGPIFENHPEIIELQAYAIRLLEVPALARIAAADNKLIDKRVGRSRAASQEILGVTLQ